MLLTLVKDFLKQGLKKQKLSPKDFKFLYYKSDLKKNFDCKKKKEQRLGLENKNYVLKLTN